MGIKHSKVETVADAANTSKVRPSDWNADHIIDSAIDLPPGTTVGGVPIGSGGGASAFTDLTDVPATYAGATLKQIRVNAGGTGLEFSNAAATGVYSIDQVWFDIRDFGNISSGDITTALQATITSIGAAGRCKTIMIPQVAAISTMTQGAITLPDPSGDPGWTLIYACKRIQFTSTLSLPRGTTIRGAFGSGVRGTGIGALGPDGAHFVGDSIAAGSAVLDISNGGGIRLDNLAIEPGGGASYAVNFFRSSTLLVTNCTMSCGTGTTGAHVALLGQQPAVKINGSFWSEWRDCRFTTQGGVGNSPCVWLMSDEPTSDVGFGLANFSNITTSSGGFKLGPATFGPNAGNVHIDGWVAENMPVDSSLIEIVGACGSCTFRRVEGADSLGNLYTLKATAVGNSSPRNLHFYECGIFSIDPASVAVSGLKIEGGPSSSAGANASASTILPSHVEFTRNYPITLDQRLVATPRAPQPTIGMVLNVGQDGATNVFHTGDTTLASILAPDGTSNAFSLQGSNSLAYRLLYSQNRTITVGDWLIFGCWLKAIDDITMDFAGQGILVPDLIYQSGSAGTDTGGGNAMLPDDVAMHDGAWHWMCKAIKILTLGSGGNPCNINMKALVHTHTVGFFNPCMQYLAVASGFRDQDVVNYVRSLKGGWATQNNVVAPGTIGILDHQQLRGNHLFPAFTFATLPSSPTAGMQYYIIDSNTATHGATVAAGGANKVMAWYNGTNWTVMGS